MRMQAVRETSMEMSLNKALQYCGMSKHAWYYTKKPRDVMINAEITDKIRKISSKRPTYGTRRMAAQVARETGTPTNRKKIQRIYRKIGWNEPQNSKKDIIRISRRRKFKPDAPNQLWETDMTYVHCGVDGWCYCFNAIDVFTREWISYIFDTAATAHTSVQSVLKAASSVKDISYLRLRTDNGTQYHSREFRKSMQTLGI